MDKRQKTNKYILELNNVSKSYSGQQVIDKLDLTLDKGQVFGLLGPNGSGKTTIIELLAGTIRPEFGNVKIFGRNYRHDRIKIYRDLGVFLSRHELYSELSVYEHLLLESRARKLKNNIRTCERFLKYFDLWEQRHKLAIHGSKGMQKKLGLCLALVHRPKLLLLDEPFEGLDPIARKKLVLLIQSQRENGVSFFITSHTLHILPELLDRVGFVVDGKIIEDNHIDSLDEKYIECYQTELSGGCPLP